MSGTGKLTLGTTTANAILATNTSGTNKISAPVELGRASGNTFSQANGGTLEISGKITQTNAGTVLSLANGSAIYTLSGDNTYSGGTSFANAGTTINVGSTTALGTGAIIVANNASPKIDNSSGGALTINNAITWGSTLTTAQLQFQGTAGQPLTIAGGVALDSSADADANVIFTVVAGSLTLSGTIADGAKTVGITTGSTGSFGTLVLSGNNTYKGGTIAGAIGKLRIKSNTALGSTDGGTTIAGSGVLEMEGGITTPVGETLTTSGTLKNIADNNEWAGVITIAAGTTFTSDSGILTVSGNVNGSAASKTIALTGASSTVISGNIGSNISTIGKAGGGTATLSGTNTYVGKTTVTEGTLLVNGTHTGGDDYSVAAAATLGGSGTINLQATKSIGVSGKLAPGGVAIDSLDVTGNVIINNGGRIVTRVNATSSDLLALTGNLNLDGASGTDVSRLDINGTLGSIASYTLATYGGLRTGLFDEVYFNNTLVPTPEIGGIGSYKLVYGSASNGDIRLVLVPEPASLAVLALGGAALIRRRRVSPSAGAASVQ